MDDGDWPLVHVNALKPLDESTKWQRLRIQSHCVPAICSAEDGSARATHDDAGVVENERGLCKRMVTMQQRVAATGIEPYLCGTVTMSPQLPPLAAIVRAQQACCSFTVRTCAACEQPLGPPLLFSTMIRNRSERETIISALGHRWLLPQRCAFFLSRLERWSALLTLRPATGYRLLLMDPPWHSASVKRKRNYETCDKRSLLEQLGPLVERLACAAGCLVAVWTTNSLAVQTFVEEALFPRWGARPVARWYWMKVSADGSWAVPGSDPASPHRKPWECLLLGYVGRELPPASLLPARLAICATPLAHSAKPPLDSLLRRLAPHLLHAGYRDEARDGRRASAATCTHEDAAWRALSKLELFAREVRPFWHAAGDEVLMHQHLGFFSQRA